MESNQTWELMKKSTDVNQIAAVYRENPENAYRVCSMGIIYRDPEDSYYDDAEFAIVKGNTVFGNLMDDVRFYGELALVREGIEKIHEALIKCIYELIPQNIDINLLKIKHVISKSNKVVDENMGKSFLLALIDEYKDGNITKEDLYAIMEHFISSSKLNVLDDEFADIINHQLPDACSYYIDEPGSKEEKELGFWKELKDIEYKLRYGHSFWTQPDDDMHFKIKEDPIEYSDEYLKIELELERLIRDEIGDGGYFGFCHEYWCTKKKILKNRFGIEWNSPVDLNPMLMFD